MAEEVVNICHWQAYICVYGPELCHQGRFQALFSRDGTRVHYGHLLRFQQPRVDLNLLFPYYEVYLRGTWVCLTVTESRIKKEWEAPHNFFAFH